MTTLWTPSRELWTPRRPSMLRKVTDWVRMATAGQTLLNSSGQRKLNSSGQQLVYDTGSCGTCGCGPVLTGCAALFTVSGLSNNMCLGSGQYYIGTSNAVASNSSYVYTPASTGTGAIGSTSAMAGTTLSACTGTPYADGTVVINRSSEPSGSTYILVQVGGDDFHIPFTDSGGYSYLTAGVYSPLIADGVQLQVSYTSSPQFPTAMPSSVTVSGGPITQVRSNTSGFTSMAVAANTNFPWSGVLGPFTATTCTGVTNPYGWAAEDNSVDSWGGYEIGGVTLNGGLYDVGGSNSQGTSFSIAFIVGIQVIYRKAPSAAFSVTGTYYADDPMTLPQTLTVA